MNSWSSRPLSACTPPLSDVQHRHGQHARVGAAEVAPRAASPPLAAAARATASETPGIALAPSRALLAVPSSWRSVTSRQPLVSRALPGPPRGRCTSCTWATARVTPLPPRACLVVVAQLDGLARAGRGARRHRGAADAAVAQTDVDPSTVGVPRESRISRARRLAIAPRPCPLFRSRQCARPLCGTDELEGRVRARINEADLGQAGVRSVRSCRGERCLRRRCAETRCQRVAGRRARLAVRAPR